MYSSYVSRMDNLPPSIGHRRGRSHETLPPDLTLFDLAVDPPALWEEQRSRIEGMMHRSCIESCRCQIWRLSARSGHLNRAYRAPAS